MNSGETGKDGTAKKHASNGFGSERVPPGCGQRGQGETYWSVRGDRGRPGRPRGGAGRSSAWGKGAMRGGEERDAAGGGGISRWGKYDRPRGGGRGGSRRRRGGRPEEDEVALVVEGDDAAPAEGRVLAEEGGEHPSDSVAETGVEVVEDELGLVGGRAAAVRDFLPELEIREAEVGGRPVRQVDHQEAVDLMGGKAGNESGRGASAEEGTRRQARREILEGFGG